MRSLRIVLTIAFSLLLMSVALSIPPASAAEIAAPEAPALPSGSKILGSKIFEQQCAGCHGGGGNIVRRGKNLKLKTLEKNQVATLEAIEALVTAGKGNMSAYRDRLSAEEITAVSQYVLDQAQAGWKS